MAAGGSAADAPFLLRAELRGHDEDVRGCLSCELGVVTASRDKTVRLWVEEGPLAYACLNTCVGHKDYVGALVYVPAGFSSEFPSGAIASGSRDATTIVWDPASAAPLATLAGHQYQVTALGLLPSGDLVSGSLDKTLKVWRGDKCVRTLTGHEGPVLCLAVLPSSGEVLSGSGDTTIRRWGGAGGTSCLQVYKGHTDTVRGLCLLPDDGVGFVSASHDMTCKVWSLSGEVLVELVGHTALVYAVAACTHPTAGTLVASGSEDNTSRVWTLSGQCLQVIEHVGCIWDVAFTPSADLLTACSDAVGRVWSTRLKDSQEAAQLTTDFHGKVKEFKEQKAAAAAAAEKEAGGANGGDTVPGLPPGLKVEPAHALQQPGTKGGQTKVVREADGAVAAYEWDAKAWQWEKIGDVVAAPTGGGGGGGGVKKLHQGREWDFVFDVDITEGAPPLKMALNRGDNPYIVADQFIEEHGLPAYFKEQIVQFITQNTAQQGGGPSLADMPVTGGGWDPLTGGGGGGSAANQYRPAAPAAVPLSSLPVTGGFVDPFTGGPSGGHAATAAPSQPPAVFLVFDNVPPVAKLATKVQELSAAVAASGSPDLALTDAEVAGGLQALLASAAQAASPQAPAALPAPSDAALSTLSKMLQWPVAQLFPALDLARLLALHPSTAQSISRLLNPTTSDGAPLAHALTTSSSVSSSGGASTSGQQPTEGAAAQQTALRLLSNCFKQPPLRRWVVREGLGQLDAFAGVVVGTGSKAVRLGWATLLHNWSVLLAAAPSSSSSSEDASVPEDRREEASLQVLSALVELGSSCPTDDPDALGRALQAMAVLLAASTASSSSSSSSLSSLKQIARDLGVPEVLRRVHDAPESKQPAWRPLLETAIRLTALMQ